MDLFRFARLKKRRGRPQRFTLADAQKIETLEKAVAAMSLKVELAIQREEQRDEAVRARVALLEAENARLRAELESRN